MKLISNLDFNGNKILNVDKTGSSYAINLPTSAGTLARLEDITAQHAFVFKGNATSYEHKGDSQADVLWFKEAQKTAAIAAGVRERDFQAGSGETASLWSLASNANGGAYNGFVFQVNDKEFASNGDIQWVELGLNIDLSDLVTETELQTAIGWDAKAQGANSVLAELNSRIGWTTQEDADSVKDKLETINDTIEENEEVVAAALNDHESRLEAVEGDAIEEIYLEGSQTALTVTNNAVTLPNAIATDAEHSIAGQNGLMSLTDKNKLDGIEASADVNILEGVQLNGTDLTITDKKVNIVNAVASTSGVGGAAGLITATDQEKLNGIATGAQVNVIEGVILSDSAQALSPDANKNVTIPNATQSADGLMSSEDKTKLDGITNVSHLAHSYTQVVNTAGVHSIEIPEQDTTSQDVTTLGHKCGLYPVVQVYCAGVLVSADVQVNLSAAGDVTVSWSTNIDPSATAVVIRIVG